MAVAVAPTTTHAHLSSQLSSSHVRLCASLWSNAGGGCGGEEESSRRGEVGLCSFSPWQGLLLCGNSQCSRLERQWCFAITRFCFSPVLRLGKSFTLLDCCCCCYYYYFLGGVFGWSLFHRKHIEDGLSTPLCLAACHFESGFFGRCLLPFCTPAWISRIEQQPHNLCCRTWNSKLGNKSESLSLPCFFPLGFSADGFLLQNPRSTT